MDAIIETLIRIHHIKYKGTPEDAIKEYLKKFNDIDMFGTIKIEDKKQFWMAKKIMKGKKEVLDIDFYDEK